MSGHWGRKPDGDDSVTDGDGFFTARDDLEKDCSQEKKTCEFELKIDWDRSLSVWTTSFGKFFENFHLSVKFEIKI